jgi:hypothetical protein
LALRYVEDHRKEYGPIFWIDARSPETVRSSFELCAAALLLPVDKASGQAAFLEHSPAVVSVLRWLRAREESDKEWLVVIDNADDVSWHLDAIVPRGLRGNVIITQVDILNLDSFWRGSTNGCRWARWKRARL